MKKQPLRRPDERELQAVVEFVQATLSELDDNTLEAERSRLRKMTGGVVDEVVLEPPSATRAVLGDVQLRALRGIRGLLQDPPEPWIVVGESVVYSRLGPDGVRTYRQAMTAHSEEIALAAAIRDLVIRAGGRLRACRRCTRLFVAQKHGAFCSHDCQQKEMNRIKNVERKAARAARRERRK